MTPLDSPSRSLTSHQESLRQQLLAAVARRDGEATTLHSLRWVHRQGVDSLDLLIGGLEDEPASGWWREQLQPDRRPTPASLEAPRVAGTVGTVDPPGESLPTPATAPTGTPAQPQAGETPSEEAPPAVDTPLASADFASSDLSLSVAELLASLDQRISQGLTTPEPSEEFPEEVAAIATEASALIAKELAPESPAEPTAEASAAPSPEPPAVPSTEFSAEPAKEPQAELATEPTGDAPPARVGRLARLRHLVRDCFEEVTSTFHAVLEPDEPAPAQNEPFGALPEPSPAAPIPTADSPPASDVPVATETAFPGSEATGTDSTGSEPTPRLPLAATPIARRSGRPAPAPAPHPSLERLRSWLPDEQDQQERRAS